MFEKTVELCCDLAVRWAQFSQTHQSTTTKWAASITGHDMWLLRQFWHCVHPLRSLYLKVWAFDL